MRLSIPIIDTKCIDLVESIAPEELKHRLPTDIVTIENLWTTNIFFRRDVEQVLIATTWVESDRLEIGRILTISFSDLKWLKIIAETTPQLIELQIIQNHYK